MEQVKGVTYSLESFLGPRISTEDLHFREGKFWSVAPVLLGPLQCSQRSRQNTFSPPSHFLEQKQFSFLFYLGINMSLLQFWLCMGSIILSVLFWFIQLDCLVTFYVVILTLTTDSKVCCCNNATAFLLTDWNVPEHLVSKDRTSCSVTRFVHEHYTPLTCVVTTSAASWARLKALSFDERNMFC